MTITNARASLAASFILISLVGASGIFAYWIGQDAAIATKRAIWFVFIMASVHAIGYALYMEQKRSQPMDDDPALRTLGISPVYWPALNSAIVWQLIPGILTMLMLDGGRAFAFFGIALIGQWICILLIIFRRPNSPTMLDLYFIRMGIWAMLLLVGLIAPFVWRVIGGSDLSGWQRLMGR